MSSGVNSGLFSLFTFFAIYEEWGFFYFHLFAACKVKAVSVCYLLLVKK